MLNYVYMNCALLYGSHSNQSGFLHEQTPTHLVEDLNEVIEEDTATMPFSSYKSGGKKRPLEDSGFGSMKQDKEVGPRTEVNYSMSNLSYKSLQVQYINDLGYGLLNKDQMKNIQKSSTVQHKVTYHLEHVDG